MQIYLTLLLLLVGSLSGFKKRKNIGGWVVKEKINPMDDTKTTSLILFANDGMNRKGDRASLAIRCKSNEIEIFINWMTYLGSNVEVLSRVGKEKAIKEKWTLSNDSESTFYPNPVSMINKIINSNKFAAEVTPYNENSITAVFSTEGLKHAIKSIGEDCLLTQDIPKTSYDKNSFDRLIIETAVKMGNKAFVTINGQTFKEGDLINGALIKKIENKKITFEVGGQQLTKYVNIGVVKTVICKKVKNLQPMEIGKQFIIEDKKLICHSLIENNSGLASSIYHLWYLNDALKSQTLIRIKTGGNIVAVSSKYFNNLDKGDWR